MLLLINYFRKILFQFVVIILFEIRLYIMFRLIIIKTHNFFIGIIKIFCHTNIDLTSVNYLYFFSIVSPIFSHENSC